MINGVTMDFFAHQEKARKKTGLLVFLFIIAVILIILCVYIVVTAAVLIIQQKSQSQAEGAPPLNAEQFFNLKLFLIVAGATVALVFLGSLFKIISLGKGGDKVAALLGGVKVRPDSSDPDEKKLWNVVEEISIASGVPMPRIYVMNRENGINAFAAGWSPSDAAIGVTRGAITILNRDELQGVVAHEFSHIMNGDMRLNIRLMGVLFGILLISLTGRILLEVFVWGGAGSRRRSRSRSGKDGGGGLILVLIAVSVALFLIGYIGVLFGRLIKAAVSRQREFLADSSAVQFTRNPYGLGGALKKIAGLSKGSKIESAHAEEASHFFFSNALSSKFLGMLSTHPPVEERIRAIDPSWDGKIEPVTVKKKPPVQEKKKKMGKDALDGLFPGIPGGETAKPGAAGAMGGPMININPAEIMRSIGQLTPAAVTHAAILLSAIPRDVRSAARDSLGARALIYAVLMNREEKPRNAQWNFLGEKEGRALLSRLGELLPAVETLGPEARSAVMDVALTGLREMSPKDCEHFLQNVEELIQADEKVTLFEYVLGKILKKNLQPLINGRPDKAVIQYYAIKPLAGDVSLVLSALVHAGNEAQKEKTRAFAAGIGAARMTPEELKLIPEKQCDFEKIDGALDRLNKAAPGVKRRVMEALTYAAAADKTVTVEEGELLRAIGESLDCPLPPLVTRRQSKQRPAS